jgi:hypothetical protein
MNQDMRRVDQGTADVYSEDESGGSIDVLGFVQRHRRGFVAVTASVGLLAVGAFLAGRALPPVDVVAIMDLTPTFPGAREGRYPNKAPYSPQDIVANAVVEPIWRSQGLEDSVPLAQVCRNLQVVSGGREVDQVRTEYVQKLSNSKLTAAERGALEAEFAAKMKAMNAASLTISLSGLDGVLSADQMTRLLAAIPVEWAKATDAMGGNAYDYPVPQGKELRESGSFAAKASSATAAVVHAERLNSFAESLKRAIDAMTRLPGSSTVRDANGTSLVDLSQELNSTRRNLVIPAYLDALAQARKLDPGGYDAIRSTRKRLLDSELEAAKERSRVLREAFTAYAVETGLGVRSANSGTDDPDRTGIIANIDGTFIDRVIEQAVKSRNIEYQRELTDRIVTAELDVVERKQQQEFEAWLEESVLTARVVDASAATATAERLADLTDRLARYADRTQAILATLSARNLNPASAMFRIDLAPSVRYERMLGTREVVLGAAAAWFAGIGLVVVAGSLADRRRAAHAGARLTGQDLDAHVAGPVGQLGERRPAPRRLPTEPREPVA